MSLQFPFKAFKSKAIGPPATRGPIAPKNCPQPIKKAKYFFGNQFKVTINKDTNPNEEPKPISNRLIKAGRKL
jgi:hypothetical protein